MFRGISGFYSTSVAVDYTAVIFCTYLVAMKCEIFTTTSTREIQLCDWPAAQLICFPLLPADFTRQSIVHARKSKWKGSIALGQSVCIWRRHVLAAHLTVFQSFCSVYNNSKISWKLCFPVCVKKSCWLPEVLDKFQWFQQIQFLAIVYCPGCHLPTCPFSNSATTGMGEFSPRTYGALNM